jgi:RNA-directed DNA polymerase
MLRGWLNYFKHADPMTFSGADGFTRWRLRAILRKQEKRPGLGKCLDDHKSWPQSFLCDMGLFTMTEARLRVSAKTVLRYVRSHLL